jgi:rubrerythrin
MTRRDGADDMTVTETTGNLSAQELSTLIQYTVEAYKTFQKLAESLPNPLAASLFKQFALDERENRDLIEMKILASGNPRIRVTLGSDIQFQEILEGDMSYRETAEFLIARERTMEQRLRAMIAAAGPADRNLLIYISADKRKHVVAVEAELELIRQDRDWWKREDAETRIIHGTH